MYICTVVGAVDDSDSFLALLTVYREFRVNSAYDSYLNLCYLFGLIWDAPFCASRDDCASGVQNNTAVGHNFRLKTINVVYDECPASLQSLQPVVVSSGTAMGGLSTRASVMLAAAPRSICTIAPFAERTKRPFPGTLKREFKSAPVEALPTSQENCSPAPWK